jgi:type VII secretion-associated serine protease mycosin
MHAGGCPTRRTAASSAASSAAASTAAAATGAVAVVVLTLIVGGTIQPAHAQPTAVTDSAADGDPIAIGATRSVAAAAAMPAATPRPAATTAPAPTATKARPTATATPTATRSAPPRTPRRTRTVRPTAQANPCGSAAGAPGQVVRDVPWQQRWLDPERVWPLATGAGQTVAVIDSGTDGRHPQLIDHVARGFDVLRHAPDDNVDCLSHGTAVASLIAGQELPNVGLRGLAPGARILPVRVTDVDPSTDPNGPRQPAPATVAEAIRWATGHGATVIDVSPAFAVDDPQLRSAVGAALAAGIVVVAAVGDRHDPAHLHDPPTYPAAYDGVIGVGAVDQAFNRAPASGIGPQVTVSAPGDGVLAATRISGHQTWTGTSIAAAFVAATAALVREAWPGLGPQQIAERIAATADPTPGGQLAAQYGRGIVDPYRAVTEQVAGQVAGRRPATVSGLPAPQADPAAQAKARWWRRTSTAALVGTGAAALALLLIIAVAIVAPRGRTRRWRPTKAVGHDNSHDDSHDATARPGDETDLFAVPTPRPDR